MATRGNIRDAFMTELRNATSIPDDDITLQGAEDTETLPQLVYNDNYRLVTYNGVGTGPQVVERDNAGNVTAARWRRYIEAQFLVEVRATDDIAKEPLYEDLRTHFGAYTIPDYGAVIGSHPKDLHSDVVDVEVVDSNSNDALDADDAIRADTLEVRIEFFREYSLVTGTDVVSIDQVALEVDNDLDDQTTGLTYTIT